MNLSDLVTHYVTFRRTLGERCQTNHDCATVCIHVPTREINWPAKNRRKLRCLRARTTFVNRPLAMRVGCAGDLLRFYLNQFVV